MSAIIHPKEFITPIPASMKRPCDWGLDGALMQMEIQLGTIETYNRLVERCRLLKDQIEGGKSKAQYPQFRTSVKG